MSDQPLPSVRSRIQPLLHQWLASSRVEEPLASEIISPNCFAWASACSPSAASDEDLSLAVMDLGLWFVYLDDYTGSNDADLFRACARVLDGERPQSDDLPALALFADHHARILKRASNPSRYVDLRRDLLAQYERRNRAGRSGARLGFDEYLDIRLSTTGIAWWMNVWEVLHGFEPTRAERDAAPVERAIAAVARWFVFVNEGRSVARDVAARVPNLALIRARDGGMSLAEAIASLDDLAGVALRDFDAAASEARAELGDSPRARVVMSFLQMCLRGAASLYSHDLERYRIAADHAPVSRREPVYERCPVSGWTTPFDQDLDPDLDRDLREAG